MLKIVLVIGPLFSGKTTVAADPLYSEYDKVEVADIVRKITQIEERTFKPDLDEEISNVLIKRIRENVNVNKNIIIIGMRQKTILENILSFIKRNHINPFVKVEYIVLDEDKSVLQKRFKEGKRIKDKNISFEEAYQKEMDLGLRDLIDFTKPFKSN